MIRPKRKRKRRKWSFLTSEIASETGLSERTVRNKVLKGEVDPYNPGSVARFIVMYQLKRQNQGVPPS